MVCYICGKPASFRCPVCGRYACNEHTQSTASLTYQNTGVLAGNAYWNRFGLICSECFDSARQEVKKIQEDQYYRAHYCDFHKCYHDDEYLKSQRWHPDLPGYGSNSLGIVYCGACQKQICIDSAIEGETKEFRGPDPYRDGYYRAWLKVTKYLCPICRNTIFLDVDIYDEVPRGWWSTSYKYSRTVRVHKYVYESEWKRWGLNTYFDNLLYWETHHIDT